MPVLGTKNHEQREGFNLEALRRKQLDKHYRKVQYLIEKRRPGDAPYTPKMVFDRLKELGLNDNDFETMKQFRPAIYNYVASFLAKKEEAPVAEEATVEEAPKKRGRPAAPKNEE